MFGTSGEGDLLLLFQGVLRWLDVSSGVSLAIHTAFRPGSSDLCSGPHALVLFQVCCFPLVKEPSRQWGFTRQSLWHPLIQDPGLWNSLSNWPHASLCNSWAVFRRVFGCCRYVYLSAWVATRGSWCGQSLLLWAVCSHMSARISLWQGVARGGRRSSHLQLSLLIYCW